MDLIVDITSDNSSSSSSESEDEQGNTPGTRIVPSSPPRWPDAGEFFNQRSTSMNNKSGNNNINNCNNRSSTSSGANKLTPFSPYELNVLEEVCNEDSLNSTGGWDLFQNDVVPTKCGVKIGDWRMLSTFDTIDDFKKWKTLHVFDWHLGTKSNIKIEGVYAYQNFKCKAHISCEAQVSAQL